METAPTHTAEPGTRPPQLRLHGPSEVGRPYRRPVRGLAAFAATALLLAACGSDDTADPPAEAAADTTVSEIVDSGADETTAPTEVATTVEAAPETTAEPEPACPPAVPNETAQPAGTVVSFDRAAYQISEGVAVDKSGNVYVSFAPLGQIVRFAPGSSEYELFAQVPDWDLAPDDYKPIALPDGTERHYGILGLALDADGNVYAAVDTPNQAGVWKFDCRTGEGTRFDGTETMGFANGLAFDDEGNLYATDSYSGMEGDVPLAAIWKITPDGVAEKWLENTTLGVPNQFNLAKPVGANGIAFRDGLLYVSILERTSVWTVPVLDDGTPGEMAPYAVSDIARVTEGLAFIPDGLALDTEGRVYVTDVVTNGIVRVEPDGTINPIAGGVEQGFDTPVSMAFGIGATELTMYAVNLADQRFVPDGKPGPALVAIDVDTPGMPLP
jgi:sugar lactone lactonase YvrE